jgi:hypothetical protein
MAEFAMLVCPKCDLVMNESKPEQTYHPDATHWLCWRCDHRFGVTLDDGKLDLGPTVVPEQVEVVVNEGGDMLLAVLRQKVPDVEWVPIVKLGIGRYRRRDL